MSRDWIVEPVWLNYSSMYREAITSLDAETGMERSHHRTAALYFGIAALEAFLNKEMRAKSNDVPEGELFETLRRTPFMDKVKRWPALLLPIRLSIRSETIRRIKLFNTIRGDLTHPKDHGHGTYGKLDSLDPRDIVNSVAEYISQYHGAKGETFPYWLWGWNYLNPSMDAHDIILINDQQFVHSLNRLGVRSDDGRLLELERWRVSFMTSYEGFSKVASVLDGLSRCEPKDPRFPFQPKLCRRWWIEEHHATCGQVSDSAIAVAKALGG